ncbi:MAG: NusG domain II-containing protein [Ruminococcaceae bacterium]|nr:NusG domain II-containing protein [Oscillospiraceae bacterium]
MKGIKEIFPSLRYGDFIIVAAVLVISIMLFVFSFSDGESLVAQVSLDGEAVRQVRLYELTEKESIRVGGCEILLERDGVTFLSSECPDKLCVNRGKLKKAGDTMACVPERVTVTLQSEKGGKIDAVVF